MARRLNMKVDMCWGCPYLEWLENGFDEADEIECAGYFCRSEQRLIVERGNFDYVIEYNNRYGNGQVPPFCDLPEDDFEPLFNDNEEE
jgi:hypothetical protein